MKNITVLIAGLMSSSLAFADGGVVDINAPFSVTSSALCVPFNAPQFAFPSIDKQSASLTFKANRYVDMYFSNCPVGTVVELKATGNMTAHDGALVVSTVGDGAADLIGAELYADFAMAGTSSGNSVTNNPQGKLITITSKDSISVNAALKVKDANSLKTIKTGAYTISIPVTVAVR